MPDHNKSGRWIHDDTYGWINENHQRLAEVLSDWDDHLRLMFIPDSQRVGTDLKPYAVGWFDSPIQPVPTYIICYLTQIEVSNPEGVLAMLFDMRDKTMNGDLNKHLDNLEAAHQIMQQKNRAEELAEKADLARSMWKSPLHTYRMGKGKKYNL